MYRIRCVNNVNINILNVQSKHQQCLNRARRVDIEDMLSMGSSSIRSLHPTYVPYVIYGHMC